MNSKSKMKSRVRPSIAPLVLRTTHDLARLVDHAMRLDGWSTSRAAAAADLCWATVDNLIGGRTKFPRLQTAIQLLTVLDYEITIVGSGPRRRVHVKDVA
jgi:hypothetical protein